MKTIKTTTGADIVLDGDILAIMETLYKEVTARKELERSFEDMIKEGQWMIAYSLGIQRDEKSPGFKHFILQPQHDPTGQMTYAKGFYDSMYGRIQSSWKTDTNVLTSKRRYLQIPPQRFTCPRFRQKQ